MRNPHSPKLGWFPCSDRTHCSRLGAPALNECVQVRPVVEDPAANLYRARPLTLHRPMSERLLTAVPQISCRVLAGHAAIGGNAYPDPLDSRHVAIHWGTLHIRCLKVWLSQIRGQAPFPGVTT